LAKHADYTGRTEKCNGSASASHSFSISADYAVGSRLSVFSRIRQLRQRQIAAILSTMLIPSAVSTPGVRLALANPARGQRPIITSAARRKVQGGEDSARPPRQNRLAGAAPQERACCLRQAGSCPLGPRPDSPSAQHQPEPFGEW